MIDKDYIEELRVLSKSEDKTEQKKAKDDLADYANTFGIKVKKTMTFDNMANFVTEELLKLAKEMEDTAPDQEDGLSINDLIVASDELDGKIVFDDVNEKAIEAVKSVDTPKQEETVVESVPSKEPVEQVEEIAVEPEVQEVIIFYRNK